MCDLCDLAHDAGVGPVNPRDLRALVSRARYLTHKLLYVSILYPKDPNVLQVYRANSTLNTNVAV